MVNWRKDYEKELTLSTIINIIEGKELSIADIQKSTKIKRSTLIYYLGLLEAQGDITKERIKEKRTGRPTIIKLTEKKISQIKKNRQKNINNMVKILDKLKIKGEVSQSEFLNLFLSPDDCKKEDFDILFGLPSKLISRGFVEEKCKISNQGLKFLKDHSKKENNIK